MRNRLEKHFQQVECYAEIVTPRNLREWAIFVLHDIDTKAFLDDFRATPDGFEVRLSKVVVAGGAGHTVTVGGLIWENTSFDEFSDDLHILHERLLDAQDAYMKPYRHRED